MMKASEIRALLSRKMKSGNVRVRASNELPHRYVLARPQTFIVNSQPNYQRGMHWVVIHLPGRNAVDLDDSPYFFDPLGLPPSTYSKTFVRFLMKNLGRSKMYFHNALQVQQHDSLACGMYCLYFVMHLKEARHSRVEKEQIICNMSVISEDELISRVLS